MTKFSKDKKEIKKRLKDLKSSEKFGDYIAEVKGIGKSINFKLRYLEVKHLRRCLRLYNNVYSRDINDYSFKNVDDLSCGLYRKFQNFGRMDRRMSGVAKRKKIKGIQRKCSFEGCKETDNLTINHIKPLSSGMNLNNKKNLELLCPKHHLLIELKHILWRKSLEMEKLKKRIELIEKKDTTDCLGYGVLSKDKFIDELQIPPTKEHKR